MKQTILEEIAAAGEARAVAVAQLDADVECLTALVVRGLKSGERPTDVAEAAKWTPAYVRKIARDHGIEPDPRYAGRAERLRAAQSKES